MPDCDHSGWKYVVRNLFNNLSNFLTGKFLKETVIEMLKMLIRVHTVKNVLLQQEYLNGRNSSKISKKVTMQKL